MAEELERIQARLDNTRTVEPILGALRTISLGSWQAALRQREWVREYNGRLKAALRSLLLNAPAARQPAHARGSGAARIVTLVVGSERGLCGRFNAAVVERAAAYAAEQAAAGVQVEWMALGSRARRLLERRGHPLAWSSTLSITALPPFDLAFDILCRWLARYKARELDAAALVYNSYHGTGRYTPTVARLLPPQLPFDEPDPGHEPWPPTIVETDPLSLYGRMTEQWVAIELYQLLLESAAAEHAARYGLMEAATHNADRLMAELAIVIQTMRQQATTREMQELAAGAGLFRAE